MTNDLSVLLGKTDQRGEAVALAVVVPDNLNWIRAAAESPFSVKNPPRVDFGIGLGEALDGGVEDARLEDQSELGLIYPGPVFDVLWESKRAHDLSQVHIVNIYHHLALV